MLSDLENPPKDSDPFFWCDFVELKALVHLDSCFSRGDLISLQSRARDFGGGFDAENRWRDLISFAENRIVAFGTSYPFQVSSDKDTLFLEYEDSNLEHRLYIGLLISASMRHIPNNRVGEIARVFEEICLAVFSNLMPKGSEVYSTWAGGGEKARYQGTLYQKMLKLAADIRANPNFKEDDFKPRDRGDGGIDLVAWHGMDDGREGIPISFAQCGCSKNEWRHKQHEAAFSHHQSRLPVMHPWANYYFLPLDLRKPDGDWACKSDFSGQVIMVDRLRILRLTEQYGIYDKMPKMTFIEDAALACSMPDG